MARKSSALTLIESLQASDSRDLIFRQVLDTTPNLIFVKDRDGRFTLANKAVADLYGTTPDEIVGKCDADFNPSNHEVEHFIRDDLDVIDNRVEKVINEEPVTDFRGVTRWFHTVKRPIQLSPGQPYQVLGVSTDITTARLLREELYQARKMEALGKLAGGVAHDFNNLLAAIMAHVEVLKLSMRDPHAIAQNVAMIEAIGLKAKHLVRKLLSFAGKSREQFESLALHENILDTVHLVQPSLRSDIEVRTELNATHSLILGDSVQIDQVILNLLVNARDAIYAKESPLQREVISICTRNVNHHTPNAQGSQECIEVLVSDSGCGMTPEVRSRIFEPFFSTKGNDGGTGLGLAMVYGIVEAHHGSIDVQSTGACGTTFIITLPIHSETGQRAETRESSVSTPTDFAVWKDSRRK